MTFVHLSYLLPIIIFVGIYIYFTYRSENNFFQWVQDHWFYKRSNLNKLSSFIWMAGFALICLALLDLRGQEERIKGNSVDQKTIILIDSSASMLAEDVRPNRFSKALLLVKHYIKKAVGQQISLVVFSDNQKRIIPFTDDIDLIKARINRLETMNLNRGGTGLSQAIIESIQYFRNTSEDVTGNILIFTDAEETEFGFDIEIPDSISVGLVGVGTRKGAPIPVRNSRGDFMGNKKFKGKQVTTKLDEDFMKKLGGIIKNYQYWIATSYSIPTESILDFFNRTSEARESENEFRVRPVLTNYLMVPGMILLIISTLLKFSRSFIPLTTLLLCFQLYAQPQNGNKNENAKEEKEPVKSELTLSLELDFAKNELPLDGKKTLAYNLLKDGFPDQANILYEEILPEDLTEKELQDFFNFALSYIQNKEAAKGIRFYAEMLNYLEKYDEKSVSEMVLNIKKNVLKALESQAGGGKGESDEENKDKEQDQDGQSGNNQNQSDKSDDQNQGKDKKNSDPKDNDDKKQDKKKKSQDQKKQQKKDQSKSDKKKDEKIGRKKVPAILKQLLSDDNNLQKKLIDAKTIERKSRDQKDW